MDEDRVYSYAVNDFRWIFLPFHLTQTESGKWSIQNRYYKPLGFKADHHGIDYEMFAVRLHGFGPAKQKLVAFDGKIDNGIRLYDDGCFPTSSKKHMDAYMKRLEILMKVQLRSECDRKT